MRPLDGITVVSLEQAVAAPYAARQLADLGARVIKIERLDGGDFSRTYDDKVLGLSSHFVWSNRSKESLALDIKKPAGLRILRQLLGQADVFIQNIAPGSVARMGLTYDSLRLTNPGIIVCNISAFGKGGPDGARKAYDLLIQCETGLISITGSPDEMAKVPISIADIATGMYAFTSILAAIIRRDRQGVGAEIDISMLEALGEWMGYPMYYTTHGGTPPPRSGITHATIAPYGPFRAGDERSVFFGIQNEREWKSFCEDVLQQPDLVNDPRFNSNTLRVQHKAELTALIERGFRQHSSRQVLDLLEKSGIAYAQLNDVSAFASHPQLQARSRWRPVATEAGTIDMLLPPVNLNGFDARMEPVPALGEHSESILRELGISPAEIDQLRRNSVI
ncbi:MULTISPECIES: CaiB/BaiF CoA transferase family protein [Paraburkholderia]|uniref:CaiB/BaiF CoA-transferase family protein n=1 Tax=Paraburkholderia metrosideri TaxID=580937 RepID=A0ABW9E6Q4_9BURK